MEPVEKKPEDTAPEQQTAEEQAKNDGFVVNPYEIVNTTGKEIDYERLIKNFGLNHVTQAQIGRYRLV